MWDLSGPWSDGVRWNAGNLTANHLGAIAAVLLAAAVPMAVMAVSVRSWLWLAWIITAAVSCIIIAGTGSRGAMVGATVACCAIVALVPSKQRHRAAVIAAVFVVLVWSLCVMRADGARLGELLADESVRTRFDLWIGATCGIYDFCRLIPSDNLNFNTLYQTWYNDFSPQFYPLAINDVLEFGCSWGLIPLGGCLAWTTAVIAGAWKLHSHRSVVLVAIIICIVVCGTFSNILTAPALMPWAPIAWFLLLVYTTCYISSRVNLRFCLCVGLATSTAILLGVLCVGWHFTTLNPVLPTSCDPISAISRWRPTRGTVMVIADESDSPTDIAQGYVSSFAELGYATRSQVLPQVTDDSLHGIVAIRRACDHLSARPPDKKIPWIMLVDPTPYAVESMRGWHSGRLIIISPRRLRQEFGSGGREIHILSDWGTTWPRQAHQITRAMVDIL